MEVVEISLTFVHDTLAQTFELNDLTVYDSLEGARTTTTGGSAAVPADSNAIDYVAAARFSFESTIVPTTLDLDTLLQSAFMAPTAETLLIMLRNLPVDNPYSKTSSVTYKMLSVPSKSTSERMSGGLGAMVGVTGALLLACVVTGSAALYRQRGASDGKPKSGAGYTRASNGTKTSSPTRAVVVAKSTSSSGSSSRGTKDNDDSYRSRIIEDDVEEIQFYNDNADDNASRIDPLLQESPLLSSARKGRKKSTT
jgi:hypothetical protein